MDFLFLVTVWNVLLVYFWYTFIYIWYTFIYFWYIFSILLVDFCILLVYFWGCLIFEFLQSLLDALGSHKAPYLRWLKIAHSPLITAGGLARLLCRICDREFWNRTITIWLKNCQGFCAKEFLALEWIRKRFGFKFEEIPSSKLRKLVNLDYAFDNKIIIWLEF